MSTLHAFEFLDSTEHPAASGCYVLFGDDRFLQVLVRQQLLELLAGAEGDFDTAVFDGETAEWADVTDQLATVGLFSQGSSRVVVVDNADSFVRNRRKDLEQLVEEKCRGGRLILIVSSWSSSTLLYRTLDKSGCQVHCGEPKSRGGRNKSRDTAAISGWIVSRAKTGHGLTLNKTVARQLLEIVDWNLGQADQELAKLALFGNKVDPEMMRSIVGGWRAQSIWEAAAAASQGKTDEALIHLDNLLQAGEHPLALFGQLSWSLRRYGRLWELVSRRKRQGRKVDMSVDLAAAGFRKWGGEMEIADASLKSLTRVRVSQFYSWLRKTDLELKGTHSEPARARFALENLFLRMAPRNGNPPVQPPA